MRTNILVFRQTEMIKISNCATLSSGQLADVRTGLHLRYIFSIHIPYPYIAALLCTRHDNLLLTLVMQQDEILFTFRQKIRVRNVECHLNVYGYIVTLTYTNVSFY
jgi:hypothetical protein